MASLGGLTTLEIAKDGRVTAHSPLPADRISGGPGEQLAVVLYRGHPDATAILRQQDNATREKRHAVVGSLCEIKDIGIDIAATHYGRQPAALWRVNG